MTKLIFFLLPLSLSACVLSYFTEPDDIARREMAKNEDNRPGCKVSSNNACYGNGHGNLSNYNSRTTSSRARYKLKESQFFSMLESPNDAIRTQAVTEIAEKSRLDRVSVSSEVISKIELMAKNDSSKWVRRASVKAIAKLSGKAAIPTLQQAQKDRDPWVRHSAEHAIQNIDKN